MSNSIKILLVLAGVLLVGVGIYYLFLFNDSEQESVENLSNVVEEELPIDDQGALGFDEDEVENVVEEIDESDEEDQLVLEEEASGVYTDYSSSLLGEGRNVIFFHAGWCPTCRALENDINDNLGEIPADVVILKADYDSERELRDRYNVNVQHTLVVVDDQGNEISKFAGSLTLDQVLSEI